MHSWKTAQSRMGHTQRSHRGRGFGFVEIIFTVALFLLIFSALFATAQFALTLVGTSEAATGATALMVERMEYIRSLPYSDIGTVSGVPAGAIAQFSTTTLNGVTYAERVLIQYIDDDADGFGGADSNGILSDYKQVKIEYTWTVRGVSNSASLVSNIVPNGIESTAGGGTIRVNVFDADVLPVSGAEVRFVNNTTTTTIDTVRFTDPSGTAFLSGAPEAANYEITVTDTDYSTDGTYTADVANPNPTTPPIAVLESQVSTMNFQIDELSDLVIETVAPATFGVFTDTFANTSLLASQASTSVVSDELRLSSSLGVYDLAGSAVSATTTPGTIESWYAAEFTATSSASTSVNVVVLYNNGGVLDPIPNTDLPGNATGFTTSPIDLTGLDTSTYGGLALQGNLSTTDAAVTPAIEEWRIRHVVSQAPISGVNLSIAGDKTIGTDGGGQPVLKYTNSDTTDGSGEWDLSDIEYDIYTITLESGGYDIYEVCPTSPLILDPGTSERVSMVLGSSAGNMLRVLVTETDDTPIPGALVRLQNTGIDELSSSSLCGQAYFGTGLYADDDYLLTVSAPGYTTETVASTTVSSSSTVTVILN